MANKPISELSELTAVADDDVLLIYHNNRTLGVTVLQLRDTMNASLRPPDIDPPVSDFDAVINRTITGIAGSNATIGSYAFARCSLLSYASFPNCTMIRNYAFQSCHSLTSISFPVCTFIGYQAFAYCSNLTNVSLPYCTKISAYAFANCKKLTSVSLPVCTSIEFNAFNYCSTLESVYAPLCDYVGEYAFEYCYSLTSISLPSCRLIRNHAFYYCFTLQSVYLTGTSLCSINNSYVFYSTPIGGYTQYTGGVYGSVFVPASLVDTYKTAEYWSTYADRITAYV